MPEAVTRSGISVEYLENGSAVRAKKSELSKYQKDYAFLKFDVKKHENHSCIPLSPKEPASGNDAWAVGFPETEDFK